MNIETAKMYFPTQISKGKSLPHKLKYLLMAPPKFGKTTFFSGVPDALMLCFEEGHQFVDCFKVVMTGWDLGRKERGPQEDPETNIQYCSAIEIVEALEVYNPFKFIIIDTLDVATKMAADYSCKQGGIKHPSEGGDFGMGWELFQTNPVRLFYHRLTKLSVGVAALTHVNEQWKKDKYGVEHFTRETSLPGGVQKFVHNTSDLIMNGMWGKIRKGRDYRDRIISFDATNEVISGTRAKGVHIPLKYIVQPPTDLDPAAPWNQWVTFFEDNPRAGKGAEQYYYSIFKGGNRGIEDENEQVETETTK